MSVDAYSLWGNLLEEDESTVVYDDYELAAAEAQSTYSKWRDSFIPEQESHEPPESQYESLKTLIEEEKQRKEEILSNYSTPEEFIERLKRYDRAAWGRLDGEWFSAALVGYAEALQSHPGKSDAYYFTACKRYWWREHRDSMAQKRREPDMTYVGVEVTGEDGITRTQVIDVDIWLNTLKPKQRATVMEALMYVVMYPEKTIPNNLQKRMKRIPPPFSSTSVGTVSTIKYEL